jgi:hypothetical protein
MARDSRTLIGQRWVHVFEEDAANGAVYRPETASLPLSRRPRERLELFEDGTARVFTGGADDRLEGRAAAWAADGETIVIRAPEAKTFRIVDWSADRLIVRS